MQRVVTGVRAGGRGADSCNSSSSDESDEDHDRRPEEVTRPIPQVLKSTALSTNVWKVRPSPPCSGVTRASLKEHGLRKSLVVPSALMEWQVHAPTSLTVHLHSLAETPHDGWPVGLVTTQELSPSPAYKVNRSLGIASGVTLYDRGANWCVAVGKASNATWCCVKEGLCGADTLLQQNPLSAGTVHRRAPAHALRQPAAHRRARLTQGGLQSIFMPFCIEAGYLPCVGLGVWYLERDSPAPHRPLLSGTHQPAQKHKQRAGDCARALEVP